MSELADETGAALRRRRASLGGWVSTDAARSVMRANVRRDTRPELAVRSVLHAAGMRYRVDVPPLASDRRRRADIVFTRRRVAIFIDGCFWHGCPAHFVAPRSNANYWEPKIARNRERDLETVARLEAEGWLALRFWEHESPQSVALEIIATVRKRVPLSAHRDSRGG